MMTQAAQSSAEGATHAEGRQEGSKDMRSTEVSYLARGQAMRAEALAEERARFERMPLSALEGDAAIESGALIRLSVDDELERVFFLVPQGGGTKLEVEGVSLTVVAPASPVGRALLGRRVDDEIELVHRGAKREHVIEEVG